jgi:hypothetical protein
MEETTQPPQPPPPLPSAYLSTHLLVPYFVTSHGEIKRPEHLIAWWSRIFSFVVPDEKDHIQLRSLCRLFRDALKPPPVYTWFPHSNYPTLNGLMDTLNRVFEEDPKKAPKLVFVTEGTFHVHRRSSTAEVILQYSIKIIGVGQNKTFLSGYRFVILGTEEEQMKIVRMQDITMMGSRHSGLVASNGLSFSCERMTFTQCEYGVVASNTKGRLINCVITQCEYSGIFCGQNALIELEGSQTKVDGNVTSERSYDYGLRTKKSTINASSSGIIHLLYPLSKESVSINNCNGQNYRVGTVYIHTVDSFHEN